MKVAKWIFLGGFIVMATGCTVDIRPNPYYHCDDTYYYYYDDCDYYYSPGIHYQYHSHRRKRCRW